jgi:ubiquinone/menaquinone biosynthesis C-methylase UbiE
MARADFNQVATVYDAGRALTDEALEAWREAMSRYLPGPCRLPGLDLGCGTGRFASALAGWLSCEVVGIDPASKMMEQAADDPAVSYILGRAESIPLRDAACDFAWLSTVVHHFDDLGVVAGEVRRVVRPDGTVFVRNWFPGRPGVTHFKYFPRAREMAETYPTIETVEAAFARAGLALKALEAVSQLTAPSLAVFLERVKTRADSTLLALSDAEFEEGLRLIEEDVSAEVEPQPVYSALDLLVFK